jgi:hypothetical protein
MGCVRHALTPDTPTRFAIVPCEAMDRRKQKLVKMAALPVRINGRIRLPKQLTAIWSVSTLPACRQQHLGSTRLASDRLATLEAANGMTSRGKTCYADT